MASAERRRHQRVTLSQPLRGAVGTTRVYVLDASISGVRIAHQAQLPDPGQFVRVEVPTEMGPIKLDCEVVRRVTANQLFHSGLAIVSADRQSTERFRSIFTAELKKHEN